MIYENLGNMNSETHIVPREARFIGLIEKSNLVLKFYEIHFIDKPSSDETLEKVKNFIKKEIQDGNIEPYVGIGFAILTNDTLNIIRWNKDYPILVQNQQYGFNEDYTSAKLLDIRETNVGSFCIWEVGVTNHERIAWRKYVDSKKTDKDKKDYLDDVIEGTL